MIPNQTMFVFSKWGMSSQWLARIGKGQSIELDKFVISSKLHVDPFVHRQTHLGEGHYDLHGSLKRKNKSGVSQFNPTRRLQGGNKVKHPYHPRD
jgi:hypothetical protein